MPARARLNHLAFAILDAFDFDDTEHLYNFEFKDATGRIRTYFRDLVDIGWSASTPVGLVPLEVGASMRFLFDYADDWIWNVQLERINPPKKSMKRAKLLESQGSPPKQSRWHDEDEW